MRGNTVNIVLDLQKRHPNDSTRSDGGRTFFNSGKIFPEKNLKRDGYRRDFSPF